MFFHHDYDTPGPGIRKDAPEKTGAARFFEIVQLECVTLVQINLLFLLGCLPVVTIPLSFFALNQVVRRMVRDEPVLCFYHFRTAFCRWRPAFSAFFLTFLPLALSGMGAWFYLSRAGGNFLLFLPFMLCSTVFLVTLLCSGYLYGLVGAGLKIREAVRLSLLLGIGKPLRAVLAAAVWYGSLAVEILEFPLSAIFILFIGFSVPCLLANFYLRTVLKKYCPEPETEIGEEEASTLSQPPDDSTAP